MATLFIDKKPYEVPAGKNLLETCLTLGFDLPYFCWHPSLGSVGACRQCAIKVFKDADDKSGKLVMSCMEPVVNNQHISITDAEAREFREHIIEWLMTNHPHDCAICDEGGSCHLQDMTVMTGHAHRRFEYPKRTYENQYLGPCINHEMNRCIQCYRCVRFYKDYAGGKDLDVFASRDNVYFGRHEEGVLESEFSGNLTEVCPTGVFTDKTLKEHYTRKWDLTTAPSICHHCSLGCNIIAGERYGTLRSIMNRYHGEINGNFICDRGRFGYEFVNAPDRVRKSMIDHAPVEKESIRNEMSTALKGSRLIGIGSARASLQSNFALRKLVGSENFYQGISSREYRLVSEAVAILRDGTTKTPTLKELEMADAVLILGEDLTNTAPMLALAVRQSVRQQPLQEVEKLNIPLWNDAAARELIQDKRGPLFIADVCASKLDELATEVILTSPSGIAELGFAIAHILDTSAPLPGDLSPNVSEQARRIADTLSAAKFPVIISGTSSGTEDVMRAAANIAAAITKHNGNSGLTLVLPSCNSAGLSLLGGGSIQDMFSDVALNKDTSVIILENDLYRHGNQNEINTFLASCANVVVLDYLNSETIKHARFVLPAATFAESDGMLVNNEGRAQRFFQVYESNAEIMESWRWIIDLGDMLSDDSVKSWKNFEDLTDAMIADHPIFAHVNQLSPSSEFRINGQRVPRAPHRYSGRTAMLANINVSEPKPPEDPDSAFSFTMEGFRGNPPASMIPFFWSPGWNSVQSVNKYQQEVGGALNGGDPGLRLFESDKTGGITYFQPSTDNSEHKEDGALFVVPRHHIFGSEELSMRSPSIVERSAKACITMNEKDAARRGIRSEQQGSISVAESTFRLPIVVSNEMPDGVVGISQGYPGVPFAELPGWGILTID